MDARRRATEDGIREAEQRGVRSDADREHEDREDRESGCSGEEAHAVRGKREAGRGKRGRELRVCRRKVAPLAKGSGVPWCSTTQVTTRQCVGISGCEKP